MLVRTIDVSAITGRRGAGRPTAWQTRDGPLLVEHLAVPSPSGELLVFYFTSRQDWRVVDVSALTGQRIAGPATSWVTRTGSTTVEHLAARSPSGDLLVFSFTAQHNWRVVNVSARTGQRIAGPVTAWVLDRAEHLAAPGLDGSLLVFTFTSAEDWQVTRVAAPSGQPVLGPLTAWRTRSGNDAVEHVAGRTAQGAVLVFYRRADDAWRAVDVSAIAGQRVAGPLASWTTNTTEHLAGRRQDGALIEFRFTPRRDWRARDLSATAGQRIAGAPAAYQLRDDGAVVQLLAARDDGGDLQLFWRGEHDWLAMNLSEATGRRIASDPVSWLSPDGDRTIEHIAAIDDSGALLVFFGDGEARRLTDAVRRPFQSLAPVRRARRQVLTILLDPHRQGHLAPAKADVEATLFGDGDSVRRYFLEVSNGQFTIENAGILGWYDAELPADYYWTPGPDVAGGWQNRHHRRYREAIEHAAREFDFARFDTPPADGTLTPDELAIVIVVPEAGGPHGYVRPAVARQLPQVVPLVVDGSPATNIVEWYFGTAPNFGVAAHELAHLLLNHVDMYFRLPEQPRWAGIPWDNPFAAGAYSLMDQSRLGTHLDGFSKLKLGWARPRLIARAGRYTLPDVETRNEVLILLDPQHSMREYFVVENRWPGTSFDRRVPDRGGLAVWHIIEDPAIYATAIPPVPPDAPDGSRQDLWAAKWATIGADGWGRRAIRMIRPVRSTFDDARALWDGTDPVTGYDLVSVATRPQHADLRWADGTPSGFALRAISAIGPEMQLTIEVPWAA